jgi:thiamine-phosphate pyrophosphorylase
LLLAIYLINLRLKTTLLTLQISSKHSIPSLHFVTQNEGVLLPPWEQARKACENGSSWISMRTRFLSYAEILPIARRTRAVCRSYGAKFIVNNNINLAVELNADGVHLTKLDIPVDHARHILGEKKIIGASVNNLEDIIKAAELGADYVALGPTKFTASFDQSKKIITTSQFLCIKKQCVDAKIQIPMIATGGITTEDLDIFLHLGLDGIAVSHQLALGHNLSTASEFLYSLQN